MSPSLSCSMAKQMALTLWLKVSFLCRWSIAISFFPSSLLSYGTKTCFTSYDNINLESLLIEPTLVTISAFDWHIWVQWAAVRIWWSEMIDPPHTTVLPPLLGQVTKAIQGNCPSKLKLLMLSSVFRNFTWLFLLLLFCCFYGKVFVFFYHLETHLCTLNKGPLLFYKRQWNCWQWKLPK